MKRSTDPMRRAPAVAGVASADDASAASCLRRPRLVPALALVALAAATVPGALVAAAMDAAPAGAHECLVEPDSVADIGTPVQGILARLLVDRADSVVAGQPVAELESGLERAGVDHAEARASMQSEIAAREADLELATLDLERVEQMYAENLVPSQQRDEARARRKVASAALVQARENRALLALELERARRRLAQRTLRSPVDGVVVERHARPGEFVYDNPVMTIASLDPLRVEVVLPARLFGTIRPGDTARVFPELDAGAPLVATVDVVDRLLDTSSGTFGVRLTLPNPELAVPGGQRCRVAFDPSMAAAKAAGARLVSGRSGEDD